MLPSRAAATQLQVASQQLIGKLLDTHTVSKAIITSHGKQPWCGREHHCVCCHKKLIRRQCSTTNRTTDYWYAHSLQTAAGVCRPWY